MKILIINHEYPPLGGGGGVATRDFAEELAKRHEVHVLTTHSGVLAREETVQGVHLYRVGVLGRRSASTATTVSLVSFFPVALWQGAKIIKRIGLDVINAQFVVPSGLPAAILSRWFKVPLVVSFIGGDVYDPTKGLSPHRHWWLRWVVRWVSEQASICTAISADTRRRAIDIHGVTKEIVVTHLGIRKSDTVGRSGIEWPRGFRLISIGRLIPRKGFEVLLRAISAMPTTGLVIIGEGPSRAKLTRQVKELGVGDRVRLVGGVDDRTKTALLAEADTYVSSAEHEGFGIVFLEAMEQGLPILATDNGGQMDFLVQEENALIVATGDDDHMARAITRISTDDGLRSEMSLNNKKKVENFFIEKVTARFEEVLLRAARG